jgi:hypothetical protein
MMDDRERKDGKRKMEFDLENPAFYLALEELAEALGAVDSADSQEADRQVKTLLQEAFPGQNFGEGSLFSLTQSGKTALEAFLEELAPTLSAGAVKCSEQLVLQAKKQAQERRKCY